MRRDMTVCRARKAAGMNCRGCLYFSGCPEQDEGTAKMSELVPGTKWTRYQLSKLEDLSLTIKQAAFLIDATEAQVRYYRAKNGLVRVRRKKN